MYLTESYQLQTSPTSQSPRTALAEPKPLSPKPPPHKPKPLDESSAQARCGSEGSRGLGALSVTVPSEPSAGSPRERMQLPKYLAKSNTTTLFAIEALTGFGEGSQDSGRREMPELRFTEAQLALLAALVRGLQGRGFQAASSFWKLAAQARATDGA